MIGRQARSVCVMASALTLLLPAGASAQPSQRERELEDLVRKLSEQIERLERRVSDLEASKADRQTEARVQETHERVRQLEQDVEKIAEDRPPTVDPQEWEAMRKWFADASTLRPYWKDGLRLDSADGSVKLKIGGRIHQDWAFFSESGGLERRFGDFDDGAQFRRARLYIEGQIYDNMEFKTQYDFAGGDADFRDVYVGFKKVPYIRNLRIGQFKEPFSLEELTSSNYITFMERSLPNTFAPARNAGVMAYDSFRDGRATAALGVFRDSNDFGDSIAEADWAVTGRITALPWYEDDGKKLLHLGVAYSHREFDDPVRFRARPESNQAPRIVDTGNFRADRGELLGAEAALVYGPFSLQGEYVHLFLDGASAGVGNPDVNGFYVYASYFLTGEHRPYKTSSGTFDRVRPLHNVGEDGGWGAWEVAGRYSYLDLNDAGVRGGRLQDYTLGLNWYLNPNIRIMWNYIFADHSDSGEANMFQTRVQIAF